MNEIQIVWYVYYQDTMREIWMLQNHLLSAEDQFQETVQMDKTVLHFHMASYSSNSYVGNPVRTMIFYADQY